MFIYLVFFQLERKKYHKFHLQFTCEFQDEKLKQAVEAFGHDWGKIADHFPDRSSVQCQHRWHKVLNPELIKGPWTKEVSTTVQFLFLVDGFVFCFLLDLQTNCQTLFMIKLFSGIQVYNNVLTISFSIQAFSLCNRF